MNTPRMVIALAGAAAVATSVANADEVRSYDLPSFDKIDVSAGIVLKASAGEPQSVEVFTKDGDFNDFEIEVRNNELTVTRNHSRLRWHKSKSNYEVRVSLRDLRGIAASSGAQAKVADVDTGAFMIDASSGAQISVAGECGDCSIDLSSGAHLNAEELSCGRASIDVSSGGHGAITVRDAVSADASSGGHVRVFGNPPRVSVDKSSGGSVKIVQYDSASSR